MGDKIFNYTDESQTDRLKRKAKESPYMIAGLAGMIGAIGVGAYKYKYRGGMSTSVFLMQFRVIAQGTVVGALTGGIIYSMINDYVLPKKSES